MEDGRQCLDSADRNVPVLCGQGLLNFFLLWGGKHVLAHIPLQKVFWAW